MSYECALLLVSGFFVGALTMFHISYSAYRKKYSRSLRGIIRKYSSRVNNLNKKLEESERQSISLINEMDRRVEQRIRDWWPDPKDFDDAWRKAEEMADRRRMRDAGRSHLPRADAAEPARIHLNPIRMRRPGSSNPN